MRLEKRSEAMPVKGIVSSELTATFRTNAVFEPNAAVELKISGRFDMSFATHYISKISRKGDLLTIHAFDLMRRLENPFDDSLYNEKDEPYTASLLINDLAHQCGFAGVKNAPAAFDKFYFRDIHGKKCREILDIVSRYAVGAWYCSNDELLGFTPFLSPSKEIYAMREECAPVYLHSRKGPFYALYAENTATGEVFSAGSASDFRNILKLSGKLFNQKRVTDIMGTVALKTYQAFYCAHIGLLSEPDGITRFYFEDHPDGLLSCRTIVRFCADEIYAEASAADICEDESDYTDLTGYELRQKVERYREYGSTVMTDRGIGFVADRRPEDERERAAYFFSAVSDAVTSFDGAIIDRIMPTSIERVSDTARRITYGGSSYLLSYAVDENGRKTDIVLEKESED